MVFVGFTVSYWPETKKQWGEGMSEQAWLGGFSCYSACPWIAGPQPGLSRQAGLTQHPLTLTCSQVAARQSLGESLLWHLSLWYSVWRILGQCTLEVKPKGSFILQAAGLRVLGV